MTERGGHHQAVLDAYQAERRLPSLVAGVLADGELTWTGEAGAPTGPDVQFRIGSITKVLTAVLVLQCRDEGLLDLDEALGRFVPESGYASATLRQLLAHTSGMQSEPVGPWWERTPGSTFAALVAANDGSGRVLPPGHAYHYSNVGFALLGEVVARLRGRPWAELVAERLWRPLGMTRTSYLPQAPAATGHSVDHLRGTLTGEPATDTGAMAPAGQVWSTVRDLARFARLLRSGDPQVLAEASIAEMTTPQAPAAAYGLGMLVTSIGGATYVGHLGSMPGFQACLHVDRASGEGVDALTNATTGFMGVELAGRLLGETTPSATRPWVPTRSVPDWAEELVGWWFWGNSAHEVRWENDRLEFRDVARGVVAERFTAQDGVVRGVEGYHLGETLHVVRRPDGTVSHLECATFVYTRVPYDPSVPIPGGHPQR